MKSKLFILVALLILLAVVVPAQSRPTRPVHQLMIGSVELKRPGWLKVQTINPVKRLDLDDLIKARPSGAKVLCSSIRMKSVPQKNTRVWQICPQAEAPKIKSGLSFVGPTRGGTNPLIPYIISPRKTLVLEDKPLIRWNSIPNATRYTVRLLGPSGQIWQTDVTRAEVNYPGTPALQPTVSYALVVQADTGASSTEEGIPGLGFQRITPLEAKRISEEAAQIAEQDLSNDSKAIALAQLYSGEGLYAAAIQLLQPLSTAKRAEVQAFRSKAAVNGLLGDLYRQVRLNLYAKDTYLEAILLSKKDGDLEAQAESQAALGEVYIALRNKTDAVQALTDARSRYIELEGTESVRAKEIAEQIATLNQ